MLLLSIQTYCFLEYIAGGTLDQLLQNSECIEFTRKLNIAIDIASAMVCALLGNADSTPCST